MNTTGKLKTSSKLDFDTLKEIADKIIEVPKMDYFGHPPEFSTEEMEILKPLRTVVNYLMYEEIHRLNHKINNHHHLVLSVEDGKRYRDNGMKVSPSKNDAL